MGDSTTSARRRITIEDLADIELISDPRISPDGQRVAYVVTTPDTETDGYRSRIWVSPLHGGPPICFTAGRKDSAPRWSPDGSKLAFISPRDEDSREASGEPKAQVWVLDTSGGEAWQVTRARHGASEPVWSPDGSRLAFLARAGGREQGPGDAKPGEQQATPSDVLHITEIHYKADGTHHLLVDEGYKHIFVANLLGHGGYEDYEPQGGQQVTDGPWDDGPPVWAPGGDALIFSSNRTPDRYFNDHSDLWVVPAAGGEARKLTTTKGPCVAPSVSPDGQTVAYFGHDNPEPYGKYANSNLWTVPLDGGSPPRNLTEHFDRSLTTGVGSDLRAGSPQQAPVWAPDGRTLYVPAIERGAAWIYQVDLASGNPTRVLGGDRSVMNFALTPDGRTLAFTATETLNPGDLYALDVEAGHERRLTALNDELLQQLDLREPEHLVYQGPDGWEIDGWLLKPAGFTAGKRYPLILEIHGGPASQYGYTFFHEFQLLAAQGYGVLYTNPRGSTGRTAAFTVANRARWGEEDYGDIMAGLEVALQRDWVDAERLGVAGGSFGGFMTNWIVGHTDRFKAAVTMRCVSNLLSFFGTSDIGYTFIETQFQTEPWENVERLLHYSPITYAKNITTPLLILHSECDYRCPIEQGEQLFVTLKKLGRETEFVRFPDEDHNLSRSGKPAHRAERLRHILRWFDRYLQA